MAKVTITNLTGKNFSVPYPISVSLKKGEIKIVNVALAELEKADAINQAIEKGYISVVTEEDPNFSDELEPTPYANFAELMAQSNIAVNTIADLVAKSVTDLFTGVRAYVKSLDTIFMLDLTSALTVDSITVLSTSGAGRWLRVPGPSLKWMSQFTWYIDPSAGDDENDGASSGTAVKTMSEVARRLAAVTYQGSTFNVLNDVPATDAFDLNPQVVPVSGTNPGAGALSFTINGQLTTLASGAVVAAVGTTPATNTPATLQDAAIVWSGYIGKLVKMTSGALSGYMATVIKDLGGNTARMSPWALQNGTVAGVGVAPGVADTFDIVSPTEIGSLRHSCMGVRTRLFYNNLKFSSAARLSGEGVRAFLAGCEMTIPANDYLVFNANGYTFMTACSFNPSIAGVPGFDGRVRFVASGILNTEVIGMNTGRIEFQNCVLQTGSIRVGRGFPGMGGDTSPNVGNLGLFAGDIGLGILDSAGPALHVTRHGVASLDAPVWGSGNLVGALVDDGGKMIIRDGITPTITGTTELSLENSGTALPGLEASAGAVLPAASALTTWAQWAAAPFNRVVMNYTKGSAILTAPNPVV